MIPTFRNSKANIFYSIIDLILVCLMKARGERTRDMKRRVCFDFVKGYFVLAMAIYHWLNYCIVGRTTLYRYVDYVTEGFIFFSGFLCGVVYIKRFHENKQKITGRLWIRGVKIFSLFVVLNVLVHSFWGTRGTVGSHSIVEVFLDNFFEVFVVGNDSLMAFEILLPISYLLLLCPLFFLGKRLMLFGLVLIVGWLISVNVGLITAGYNAKALMIGFGGVCSSIVIDQRSLCRTRMVDIGCICLAILYFVVFVPFVGGNGAMIKYFIINIVIINLIIICGWLQVSSFIVSELALIGRFSLMLYLYQIAYLKFISSVFSILSPTFEYGTLLVLFVLVVSSSVLCRIVDLFRRKSSMVNKIYMTVFQ